MSMLADLRFALRTMRKRPGFALSAAITLAIGIGATTAIFSVLSGILLQPLPFARPERLMQISQNDSRTGIGPVFWSDLQAWRRRSTVLDGVAAYWVSAQNLLDVSDPERLSAVLAERGLFRVLGVQPLMGRTFRDDDSPGVVVLSDGLWRRRFGADKQVLNRRITLDGEGFTVIGVMPRSFQFPYRSSATDIWLPWTVPAQRASNPNTRVESVVARLKQGVTAQAARADLDRLGRRVVVTPLSEAVTGGVRRPLLILLGAAGLVLFLACANVANLSLAQASRRAHEMSVRAALGAGRGRLVRQLLTESLLLGMAGGLGGLAVAIFGARAILRYAAAQLPRAWEIGLDWRVFCFLFAASAGSGIAFGILPALTASREGPLNALRRFAASGWTGRRLRDGLVIGEIALSFVLLVSAGLLLRGFVELKNTPMGLDADRVLTMRMTVAMRDIAAPGAYGRYLGNLEERLRGIPGVRAAGFIQYLPLRNWGWYASFSIRGRPPVAPDQRPQAELRYVTRGYFESLGIPLRRGRSFSEQDTEKAPTVILVNEALAHRYFPGEDAVGKVTDRGMIVGVVGDVRTNRLDRPASPEIYYSFVQNTAATSDAGVSLTVKTEGPPEEMARSVISAIHEANPRQVVFGVGSMDTVISDSLSNANLYVWLVGLFAVVALVLAVSGIYAVVSCVVNTRTQEFGIRRALGADGAQILRLVFFHGSKLVAWGVALGAVGTFWSTRLLGTLLSGVTSGNPGVVVGVVAVLSAAGLLACAAPAHKAIAADPGATLKYE